MYLRLLSPRTVGGILIPYRIRDKYDTWWDEHSDLGFELLGRFDRPIYSYHLLREKDPQRIGWLRLSSLGERPDGLYGVGELEGVPEADAFLQLVASGQAAWSTGAYPPGIRTRADGYQMVWPWVEVSGLHVDHAGSLPGTTTVGHVRGLLPRDASFDESLVLRRSIFPVVNQLGNQSNGGQSPAQTSAPQTVQQQAQPVQQPQLPSVEPTVVISVEMLQQLMAQRQAPAAPAPAATPPVVQLPQGNGLPSVRATAVQVLSEFDGVSLMGLLFWDRLRQIKASQEARLYKREEPFMRAVVDKMRVIREREEKGRLSHIRSVDAFAEDVTFSALRCIDREAYGAWHAKVPFLRADEALQSTLAGSGDELVPMLMSSVAYFAFMMESRVMALLDQFVLPSNPFPWPVIGAGVRARQALEVTDRSQLTPASSVFSSSKPSTSNPIVFTALRELAIFIFSSEILLRDAGLNVADVLAQEAARRAASEMDYVILNGDERTTSSNISYSADPTGTNWDKVLLMDGLRRMAQADSTTETTTTTLASNSGIVLCQKMGSRGIIGRDLENLFMVIDPGSAYKLDQLSSYDKLNEVGQMALLLKGQLGVLRGIPLICADELRYTTSSGLYPGGSTNDTAGTVGQQLMVHRKLVKVGRTRDVALEMGPIPFTGAMALLWRTSFDVQRMESGAVAWGYNRTV